MMRSGHDDQFRPKAREGRFVIDGERGELVWFLVRRKNSIAITGKSSTAVSLLAALAGGKETVFDIPGLADVTFDAHGYADALKRFVKSCPSILANR